MSPRKQQSLESDQQRRAQILHAAATVFAEKGFHKATTKEIARVAGISEGTIYNYFAQKRDLLLGLLQSAGDMGMLADIQASSAHDAKTYYIEDARLRLGLLRQSRHLWRAILPEVLVDAELRALFLEGLKQQYSPHVEAYLRERMAQGELAPIEDIPLTARVMLTIPMGLLLLMLLDDSLIDSEWDRVPQIMARLVYDGLKNKES